MTSVPVPIRENPREHRCVCVLVRGQAFDVCPGMVQDPEQAFCASCEHAGHPESEFQVGLEWANRP